MTFDKWTHGQARINIKTLILTKVHNAFNDIQQTDICYNDIHYSEIQYNAIQHNGICSNDI